MSLPRLFLRYSRASFIVIPAPACAGINSRGNPVTLSSGFIDRWDEGVLHFIPCHSPDKRESSQPLFWIPLIAGVRGMDDFYWNDAEEPPNLHRMILHFALWILTEAATAVCVPGLREVTLPAMHAFGGYALEMPYAIAMLGAAIGSLPVWGLGMAMTRLRQLNPSSFPEHHYQFLRTQVRRYGWLLLPFYAILPLGGILPLLAGFFRMPLHHVLLCMALGRAFVALTMN
ncbi:MAG: hypothetical protein K2Q12_01660 [Rickettsiales bacterium]|nr:hypothetical protein [Rickettsiales bacterium]